MTIAPIANPLLPKLLTPEAPHRQNSSDIGSRIYSYLSTCFSHNRRNSDSSEELKQNQLLTDKIHKIAKQIPDDTSSLNNSERILKLISSFCQDLLINKNGIPLNFDSNLVLNAQKSLSTSTNEIDKLAAADFLNEFSQIKATFTNQPVADKSPDKRIIKAKLYKFARAHDRFKIGLETRRAIEEGKKALAMANSHNPELAEKGLELLQLKHPLIYKSILKPSYIYRQSQIHNMILGVRDHLKLLKKSPKQELKFRDALTNSDSEVFFTIPALGILKTLNKSLKINGISLRHNSSWDESTDLPDSLKDRFQELTSAKEELQNLIQNNSVKADDISLALTDKEHLQSNPQLTNLRNKLYSIAVKMSQEFSRDFEDILQEIKV